MATPTTSCASSENGTEAEFVAPLPLSDRILVRRDAVATATESGLIIPDSAQPRPKKGIVIAVGPGRQIEDGSTTDMEVEVGDHVWFSPYAGMNVEEAEREEGFLVMRMDDVQCRDLRPGELDG